MNDHYVVILTFGFYFILMLGIGFYAWFRTVNSSDYFLGGRQLGPVTSALSASASDMSGWLLIGLPGFAYVNGLESVWLAAGLLIGNWLNWLMVAKRLRIYSYMASDSLTIPEFFANRFESTKGLIEPISSIIILVFFLFYTSSGLVAGGKLFASAFDLDYHTAVIIGVVSVISYTLFGGFLAVCWTDLVQGLLMLLALVIVPIVAINSGGGMANITHELKQLNGELFNVFTDINGQSLSWIAIVSLLGWGLGYFGQPHILARFKAIQCESQLPFARRISFSWTTVCMVGALLVGLSGIIYIKNTGITLDDPESIFILMVNTLFNPVVAGVLLAAILAAIMSTVDSQLLICSATFTEDLYLHLFNKNASQKTLLLIGRLTVVVVALIATYLAWNPENSVLNLVSYAWAGFGAAFGPAIVISLYWKRMNAMGALAGIFSGAIVVVVWKHLDGGIFELYEIIPGMIVSSIAIIVFSYLGREPSKENVAIFDQVMKKNKLPIKATD